MATRDFGRNSLCPCGSGKKYKRCCQTHSFKGPVLPSSVAPNDGAFLMEDRVQPRAQQPQLKAVTRVAVHYAIRELHAKAEVVFCYPLGTRIIMTGGDVLPVEWLRPGMRFRLEDRGFATVTKVEEPEVWSPPSLEKDADGNSIRRVIGHVKYTGYYPRLNLRVSGELIRTTPGHLFFSVTRQGWFAARTFSLGEHLRNGHGKSVAVEWIGPIRSESGDLYNIEVEDLHTYFVGSSSVNSVWTHNGLNLGCSVPKAAIDEALELGVLNQSGRRNAGLFTDAELNPQHHLFPQEFRAWFAERGLDIDQYTARIPRDLHDTIHVGGGPGRGGGWYNQEVMQRLTLQEQQLGRQLTPYELEEFGITFMERFGFGNALVLPYVN